MKAKNKQTVWILIHDGEIVLDYHGRLFWLYELKKVAEAQIKKWKGATYGPPSKPYRATLEIEGL